MSFLSMDDVDFEAMRSGGPGGQHSDRRSTAVRLRVDIDDMPIKDERKEDLRDHLPPRCLTKDGELIVENGDSRSQRENRNNALEQANEQIKQALEKAKQEREKQQRKKRSEASQGGGGGSKDIKEEQKNRRRSESTEDLLRQAFEEDPDRMERFIDNEGDEDSD